MRLTCAHETEVEVAVRSELLELLGRYDLEPWQVTDEVVIEEGAIPHSHPVLTLGTFNRGPFLLASYVHEQLHWFLMPQMERLDDVYESDLLRLFPNVPADPPEGGHGVASTYLHLVVCWYEVEALRHLLGQDEARRVVDILVDRGVYRWVYRTVSARFDELGEVYARRGITSPLSA